MTEKWKTKLGNEKWKFTKSSRRNKVRLLEAFRLVREAKMLSQLRTRTMSKLNEPQNARKGPTRILFLIVFTIDFLHFEAIFELLIVGVQRRDNILASLSITGLFGPNCKNSFFLAFLIAK